MNTLYPYIYETINLWNTNNIIKILENNNIIDSQNLHFQLKNGFYSEKEFLLLENYIIWKNENKPEAYLNLNYMTFEYCKKELKLIFFLNSNYLELKFDDITIYKLWKKICIRRTILNNFHKKFTIKSKIYENNGNMIFKVKNKKNKNYILKKLIKNDYSMNEIKILKTLNHKNVINILYLYESKNSFYLIMKYCNKNSLEESLNKIKSEKLKISIINQILEGINYIHTKKVVHRDLKPKNIFLHKNKQNKYIVKIGDFGLSNFVNDQSLTNNCGSLGYIAPELFNNDICTNNINFKSDIYSIGHIIYNVISNKFIFDFNNQRHLLKLNKKNIYSLKNIRNENISNVIEQCLKNDPFERTTIKNLQNVFKNINLY